MDNERYKYSVYVYSKNYDGSLNLINLKTFDGLPAARIYYIKMKSEIRSGVTLANCLELNKDVYLGDDALMSTSENLFHYERHVDFAI